MALHDFQRLLAINRRVLPDLLPEPKSHDLPDDSRSRCWPQFAARRVIHPLRRLVALLVLALAPWPASADTMGLRLLFVGDAAPFSSIGAAGNPEGYAVMHQNGSQTVVTTRECAVMARGWDSQRGSTFSPGTKADLLCGPVSDTVARQAARSVLFQPESPSGGLAQC